MTKRFMIALQTSYEKNSGTNQSIYFKLHFLKDLSGNAQTNKISIPDLVGDDNERGGISTWMSEFGDAYPQLNAKSVTGITIGMEHPLPGANKPNWKLDRVVLVFLRDLNKKLYKPGNSTSEDSNEYGYVETVFDKWIGPSYKMEETATFRVITS